MHGYTANTGRRQLHTHGYLPVAPRVLGRGEGQLQGTEGIFSNQVLLLTDFTLSEGVQEHAVLEFTIAYMALIGRCELTSRQTVVGRGRPVAGSLVFTGCQSAYCRWLLRHVAITIYNYNVVGPVFFQMIHKIIQIIYAAIRHGSLHGAHASAFKKGSLSICS